MTYWTILWITFVNGPLDGNVTYLIYPSHKACMAAHQIVSDTLGYDHQIACEETDTMSASTRPKPRPENLK